MLATEPKRALLWSCIVHLVLVVVAFLVLKNRSFPPEPAHQILVQITETPPGNVDSRAKSPPELAPRKKSRSIRLKDLGVPFGIDGSLPVARKSEDREKGDDDGDGSPDGNGIDLVAEGKSSKMFRFIRQSIENDLTYPSEFKQRAIQGTVHAKVAFSANGEFLEGETEIRSSSSYLKVLVARTLRKAFREPIPENKRTISKKFTVQCAFIFQITEQSGETAAKFHSTLMGRHLAFYRNYQHSVLQWQIGPLSGFGPFAGLDILWFPKKVGEILSKKAKIDPMEAYQNDPAW